jgi:hypothetical protein
MNEINVYWSNCITSEDSSWSFLYREPEPLYNDFLKLKIDNPFFACPANIDMMNNIYSIKSNLEDKFNFPENYLKSINGPYGSSAYLPNIGNKISLVSTRQSALKGYKDIKYNMSWIFFAEEFLSMKITAPYYPPKTPVDGAILQSGEYDIGQWFRPYNLGYFIPEDAKSMSISVDDPLVYLEFKTDKKINFKKFKMTNELVNIYQEFTESPPRYGKRKSLIERYSMAKKAKMNEIVLSEIKKNLVL